MRLNQSEIINSRIKGKSKHNMHFKSMKGINQSEIINSIG